MKQEYLLRKITSESSLNNIQEYIKKVIQIRGFENQGIEQQMLMLTEEVGELAKAIRKDATTMSIDKKKIERYETIESEIADITIVLISICNSLHINLLDALVEKEKINVKRQWQS